VKWVSERRGRAGPQHCRRRARCRGRQSRCCCSKRRLGLGPMSDCLQFRGKLQVLRQTLSAFGNGPCRMTTAHTFLLNNQHPEIRVSHFNFVAEGPLCCPGDRRREDFKQRKQFFLKGYNYYDIEPSLEEGRATAFSIADGIGGGLGFGVEERGPIRSRSLAQPHGLLRHGSPALVVTNLSQPWRARKLPARICPTLLPRYIREQASLSQ